VSPTTTTIGDSTTKKSKRFQDFKFEFREAQKGAKIK
jgi:hypothetical protein